MPAMLALLARFLRSGLHTRSREPLEQMERETRAAFAQGGDWHGVHDQLSDRRARSTCRLRTSTRSCFARRARRHHLRVPHLRHRDHRLRRGPELPDGRHRGARRREDDVSKGGLRRHVRVRDDDRRVRHRGRVRTIPSPRPTASTSGDSWTRSLASMTSSPRLTPHSSRSPACRLRRDALLPWRRRPAESGAA